MTNKDLIKGLKAILESGILNFAQEEIVRETINRLGRWT